MSGRALRHPTGVSSLFTTKPAGSGIDLVLARQIAGPTAARWWSGTARPAAAPRR